MKRWITVSCLVLISALGTSVPAGAQASTATAGALTSGKPVKATISKHGQQIKYTFAATANKNVTFNVTHFNFTNAGSPREVFIDLYEPGSSSIYAQCNNGVVGNTTCSLKTPAGGTWKAELVPFQASIGSLTLKLS
jgi:hypothetical protein